ncbi:hypothetical protein D9M68_858420 [compost metagenome]
MHIQAFQAAENVRAGALQGLRRIGQVELLADIVEQWLAEQLFQLANLQADGGLGQRHLLCGAAVGEAVAHRAKNLQLAKCHAQQ